MLIGNYSVLAKDPGRSIGGGAIGLGMNRGDWNKTSMSRGVFNAVDWEPKSGVPDGYRHPYAWVMPQEAGSLSARNSVVGVGTISTTALAVRLAQADLTGSGDLEAIGGLIVQLVADLGGAGEISDADLKAFLQAVASIGGSGGISSAQATGLGQLVAAMTGLGTVDATLTGTGELTADLVVTGTGLTTGNVGAAVWAWIIEAGYIAEEVLRIIAAHAAGAATGLEGANPQFTGLDGSTVRIDGTYSAGTRTIDALDGS